MLKKLQSLSLLLVLILGLVPSSITQAAYFPSSADLRYDEIELKTLGNVRVKVDSEGKVGIGAENPERKFQLQSDRVTGTQTISSLGTAVTGSLTIFQTELEVGGELIADGQSRIITAITSDTELTVTSAFSTDLTSGTTYEYTTPEFWIESDGDTTVDGNLTVTGTSTLNNVEITTDAISGAENGSFFIQSWETADLSAQNRIGVAASGEVTVTSTTSSTTKDTGSLVVEGGVGIEENLNVGGDFDVQGTANIVGNTSVVGMITSSNATPSTSKDTGAIVVEGGIGVEENVNIGGNLDVSGTFNISGDTGFTGLITAESGIVTGADIVSNTDSTDSLGTDAVRFANTYTDNIVTNTVDFDALTGGNEISVTDNVADGLSITDGTTDIIVVDTTTGSESVNITPDTNITGDLDVTGTTSFTGNTTAIGVITSTNIANSTDKDTGAVILEGGIGVEKNANIGGNLGVVGTVDITGDTTVVGTIESTNATSSTSKDTGAIVVDGGMGVEENINLGGSIDFTVGSHSIGSSIGANDLTLGGGTSSVVIPGSLYVQGTTTSIETTTLDVETKIITVNDGGVTASAMGAGLVIDGDATTGHIRVSDSDAANLELKAPTGNELTLDINSDATITVTSDATLNQDVSTSSGPTFDGGITVGSNIISDTDSTDDLGTTATRWLNAFVDTFTGTKFVMDGATGVNEIAISNNVADGLSITDGTTDIIVVDTSEGTESITITPDTNITGNLDVIGTIVSSNVTSSTTKDTGAVILEGGIGIEENANVGGNLDVIGTTDITGDTTVAGRIVSSNATPSTTKDTGALVIEGGIGVEENVNIGGNLTVTGTSTLNNVEITTDAISGAENGVFYIQTWQTADITPQNRIGVASSGEITISSTTISTSKDTGALVVEGGVGIEENANIGGNLGVVGTVNITGNITNAGMILSSNATSSTSKDTGALVLEGGIGIEENANIGGNLDIVGIVDITGNTTTAGRIISSNVTGSTNKDTGALVVEGGVGIEENVFIGGDLDVGGSMTLSGTTTFTGQLTAEGGIVSGADIVSDTDSTYSLGASATRWLNAFADSFTGTMLVMDGITGTNEIAITDNVADGLSITDGTTDIIVVDTTTGSESVNITPDTNITGDLDVTGTTSFTGNTTAIGVITSTNIANSTDKDTGAVILEGGIGVEKNANIGGNLGVVGTVDITGDTTVVGTIESTNATPSTSKDTGAIVVDGGMGVEENIYLGGNIDFTTGSHTIGSSLGANDLTLGAGTSSVIIPGSLYVQGTTTSIETTNLDVETKIITVNDGGITASSLGAGIVIDGDTTTGHLRVSDSDAANLELKASTGNELTLDINADATLTVTGNSNLNQDVSSSAGPTFDGGITVGSGIVSNTDSTDDLGTTAIRWLNAFVDTITGTRLVMDGTSGVNEIAITDNVADGLSITNGVTDIIVVNTTTGTESVNITPNTNITGNLDVIGTTDITGDTTVAGRIVSSNATPSTSKDTGALVLEGGVGVEGNMNIGGSLDVVGTVDITGNTTTTGSIVSYNTASSTSKDSGAFVIEGGVGVEENLYIGGHLDVDGGLLLNIVKKTADYTATIDDYVILCDATSNDVTVTLPSVTGVQGLEMTIKKVDSSTNSCYIDPNGSETIDGLSSSKSFSTQYTSYTLITDGTEWWIK